MFITIQCTKEEDGNFIIQDHEVIIEEQFTVWVNGRRILNAMTSPVHLKEFAVGYLITEGIIASHEDIDSLQIEEKQIRVLTKNRVVIRGSAKTVLSGCGGDSSFLDPAKLPAIRSDFVVSAEHIHLIAKKALDSDLHRLTGGIHVVGLADNNDLIAVAEDIGRHNALDRVIGYANLGGIDVSRTFVMISGRISSEMIRKCLIAGVPVIASRGATTSMAISLASGKGLTIIGFIRGRKMNVYTHPERIIEMRREG